MDLKGLTASRGDDAPSGENLEYDMDFINLELAAQPGEEKQAGDEIVPAEDPDWSDVKDKAMTVLERSHDLRAAVHLAQAVIYTDGLEGFAETTAYIRSVLENFWDSAHPQLDPDDDDDPTSRINATQGLAGSSTVLRGLRRAALAESRGFGRVSLRDIQLAAEGSGDGPDAGGIAAAFQDTGAEVLTGKLAAIKQAIADVNAIDGVFNQHLPGQGPNFDDLVKMLRQMSSAVAEHAGGDVAAAAGDMGGAAPAAAASSGGGGGGAAVGGVPGSIGSLNDVHTAIDKIMAFYQRAEPSSPVPILLARAKKLVGADFMTIMKDMAPNGLDNVRVIGGLEDEDYRR